MSAPAEPAAAPTRAALRHHRDMLILSVCIAAAALLLQVDGEHVHVVGAPGLALPPLCGSRILFDRECPACGLTRSIVQLAHGECRAAFASHRVGWLFALAIVIQIPYRLAALRRGITAPLGRVFPLTVTWVLIGALIANWIAKLLGN